MQDYQITTYGNKTEWTYKGKLHREDGPAVEYGNGGYEWWLNGKRHREDCPAYSFPEGAQSWWVDGKRHRDDGPAVIWANGKKEWWYHGREYTEEEYLQISKPVKELTVPEIERLLGFKIKIVA